MEIETINPNYKIRITRCYFVELIDKDGYIQQGKYNNNLADFCFGTKQDAIITGKRLLNEKIDNKTKT